MAATGLLGINPYRKGVALDISSKPTALYVDMQQKERARQDALDRYFMEYDKNINPAGMRTQDINGLLGKQMENKSFYFQNKKAIQNPAIDGGRAYTQWMNSNKEMLAKVSESKQAAANGLIVKKANIDAKKNGMVTDDETMNRLMASEISIWDKDYQPFDVASYSAYKPFDPIEFKESIYGKGDERFTRKLAQQKKEGASWKNYSITDIDPSQLPQIETEAKARLINGARLKDGFSRYVMSVSQDADAVAEINKVLKQYGRGQARNLNDIALGVTLKFAPYKMEEKIGALTPETRILISNATKTTTTDPDDIDTEKRIIEIRNSSPEPTTEILQKVKSLIPVQGLKNVIGSINAKYRQDNLGNVNQVLQDTNNNLYAFSIDRNGNIKDATGQPGVTFVPYSLYKLEFTNMYSKNKTTRSEAGSTAMPSGKPATQPTPSSTFGSNAKPRGK
jgi:hypothetical protein